MSRPPNQHHHLSSAYNNNNNRNGLIDFVNVPMNLGQPYMDGEAFYPSIYAQAGFPGYNNNNNNNNNNQLGAYFQPQPIASQAFLPSDMGAQFGGGQCGSGQCGGGQFGVSMGAPYGTPVESETVLHQRINEKIDSIIQSQRDNMLTSKIESLSGKVQQLSQNISYNMDSSEASHINRLSDKVQQLSQSMGSSEAAHISRLSDKVQQLSQSMDSSEVSHINRLSDKVQQLSQSMDSNDASHMHRLSDKVLQLSQSMDSNDASHMQRLSDKVQQLSQNLERSERDKELRSVESKFTPFGNDLSSFSPEQYISSTPSSDREISRRLQRLAAESNVRQRDSCKIPDW